MSNIILSTEIKGLDVEVFPSTESDISSSSTFDISKINELLLEENKTFLSKYSETLNKTHIGKRIKKVTLASGIGGTPEERSLGNIWNNKSSYTFDTYTLKSIKVFPAKEICDNCQKESNKLCSGCNRVFYCSRKCQLNKWNRHKLICKENKIIYSNPELKKMISESKVINPRIKVVLKNIKLNYESVIITDGEDFESQYLSGWITIEDNEKANYGIPDFLKLSHE